MLTRLKRLRPYVFDLAVLLAIIAGALLLGQTFAGRLSNLKSGTSATLGDVIYSVISPQIIHSGLEPLSPMMDNYLTCELVWRRYDNPDRKRLLENSTTNSEGFALYGLSVDQEYGRGTLDVGASSSGHAIIVNSAGGGLSDPRPILDPDAGVSASYLRAIAQTKEDKIWAVGSYDRGGEERTLFVRWNEQPWGFKADHTFDHPGALYAISAATVESGTHQLWAVGSQGPRLAHRTLIDHFDGNTWQTIGSPNMETGSNDLYGVSGISANDAWAVGSYVDSSAHVSHTLALRWDGGRWAIYPGPDTGRGGALMAVSAVSANEVWAAGSYLPDNGGPEQTLVERWDGSRWSVLPSPTLANASALHGVAAISGHDVWVVGSSGASALLEHWDGKNWTVLLDPSQYGGVLTSVVARSSEDVRAAGYYEPLGSSERAPILMQYDNPRSCTPATPTPVTDNAAATNAPTAAKTAAPLGTPGETATGVATILPAGTVEEAPTATKPAPATEAATTPTEQPVFTPTETRTPIQTPAPPKQGTITLWVDKDIAKAITDAGASARLTARYGAPVSVYGASVSVQEMEPGEILDRFEKAAPQGDGPDVIVGSSEWLGELVSRGLVSSMGVNPLFAVNLDPAAVRSFTHSDNLYGLPYGLEAVALMYNTELVPTPPATWDDLKATAKRLQDENKGLQGFVLPRGDPYSAYPIFTGFGGYVFGTDAWGNYNPQDLGLDSPGGKAAMSEIDTMVKSGLLRKDIASQDQQSLFEEEKSAMWFAGPGALRGVRGSAVKDKYAVTTIPRMKGVARPFVNSWGFMVNARGKNAALGGLFLAEFMATDEAMQAIYDARPDRVPTWKVVRDRVSDPDMRAFARSVADGQPLPVIPQMAAVWDDWTGAINQVFDQAKPPEQAISDAAKSIRERIAGGKRP